MKIKKAVTFRASSIGDCLMGKYVLENIHRKFPEARCGIVVASRGAMIRDLLAVYPWIEVIEANRHNSNAVMQLWRAYRRSELVIMPYAGKTGGRVNFASKVMGRFLAREGGLIGFEDISVWNTFLFSTVLPIRSERAVIERDREALKSAGIAVSIQFPKMICIEKKRIGDRFRVKNNKFLVVHLFSGNKGRELHPNKKRALIEILIEKFPNTQLIISGGENDKEEAMQFSKNESVTVVAGQTSLQELMNLILESRGVISLDTGVAHITAQLGKPLVVLSTCLGRNWWFPEQYGEDAPITIFSCDDVCVNGHMFKNYPDCLNKISIESVIKAIK